MATLRGPIAFVDVLGFSQRAQAADLDPLFDAYEKALAVTRHSVGLNYVVSSDSIVVTPEDSHDSDTDLLLLAWACGRLLHELSKIRVPVRGCISHGSFVRRETANGTIVAGRPIVEAYDYERRQGWVGIMMAPSVLERFDRLADTGYIEAPGHRDFDVDGILGPLVCQNASIPLQVPGGDAVVSYQGYAVLPLSHGALTPSTTEARTALKETVQNYQRMASYAPDARAQAKYVRAVDFLLAAERRIAAAQGQGAWDDLTQPAGGSLVNHRES